MRTLLMTAVAAALLAGPTLAQEHDHKAHQPAATQTPPAAPAAAETPTHEQCKAIMGARMQPQQRHDHLRDKTGQATPPKPLTEAEMARRHDQCAAMMAKPAPATPAPK